jgi:hypothetical protein
MSSQTMVFGAETRRSEMWRVYRIRTAHSAYELEVQTETTGGARRCAVMTCVEPEARAGQTFEDSSPLCGSESLYGVNPLDWIGRVLRVGTVCTSEIQSVDFVKSASTRTVTRAAPAPARSWAPYPLGQVEMLETAASVLKAVAHQHELRRDLSHDRRLVKRFELALAECQVMLETLTEP